MECGEKSCFIANNINEGPSLMLIGIDINLVLGHINLQDLDARMNDIKAIYLPRHALVHSAIVGDT